MQLLTCWLQWSELPTTTEVWKQSSYDCANKSQKSPHKCSQLLPAFAPKPCLLELLLTKGCHGDCHTAQPMSSGSTVLLLAALWVNVVVNVHGHNRILSWKIDQIRYMDQLISLNTWDSLPLLMLLSLLPSLAWLKTFEPVNNRRLPPLPHFEAFLSYKLYIFTYLVIMYHFETAISHFSAYLQTHPPIIQRLWNFKKVGQHYFSAILSYAMVHPPSYSCDLRNAF